MNSNINIPFNVIQRVNTSLRISREIPQSQLSYLKVIDLINIVYTVVDTTK